MRAIISRQAGDFIRQHCKDANVVCLTGAGISYESGIPLFRGKSGLWEKYDPDVYATMDGLISVFRQRHGDLAKFVFDFYSLLYKARPNPAHTSLAALESAGIVRSVITQNIDNLHQEAGSRAVIELHGNALRIRCLGCRKTFKFEKERSKEMAELLKKNMGSRMKLLKVLSRYFPRCKDCGSRFRIDIVLFGEALSENELSAAYEQLAQCDVLLIVGSSLLVYPAAGLPLYAKDKGAKLIEVNTGISALSDICDYSIMGKAGIVLPEIAGILCR
ncbi:MAG: NAD-dependent deacylase [Candidatus Omnitrophica bacterium]|nr:NAD-dependent deacylase [Candidatus Omnitrophota bacterium]